MIYAVNMGTQKQNRGSKNSVNQGYLVVLKGRKIGYNYNCENRNRGSQGMHVDVTQTR